LYLQNGGFVIIPGISVANNSIPISQHNCGATNVHNTNLTYGSMTDQDGNVYKTIVIGTQEWMAENLKASHYRNGDVIPIVTNNATWAGLTTGAISWYITDSTTYNCPYGKLYNWYAVADSRHVCPSGWHEPIDIEWSTLINYLDPNANGGANVNTAGGKMKSFGTQYWASPNTAGDNSSGFSGLPGGQREYNGIFTDNANTGYWWSSNEFNNNSAKHSSLTSFLDDAYMGDAGKINGFSVRCIKD
jgi:uncharacterized protein (TIGR02145 family)